MLAKLKIIRHHSQFIKYFKNTSWLLGESIFRMVVGLFIGIWVARYLGPTQFGLISYAQSLAGLFTIVATLGLDTIVIRELVINKKNKGSILGTAFILKLVGAFSVLLFLAITLYFTSNNHSTNLLIFIIASGIIFQSFNVIDFDFQSKVLSKYVAFAKIITLLFSSVIKVLLIINDSPLVTFAYVILFDSFVLSISLIYFYLYNNSSFKPWFFQKSMAFFLLKESWPLILSAIVVSIYMRIDQVMIMEILGSEAVGQYAAAVRLSEAWYFIPMIIASSVFPAIIKAKEQNEKLYYSRLQNLFDLVAWLGITIAVLLSLINHWLVEILYGAQYYQAGSILIIHVWGGIFVGLGVASGKWLISEGFQILSFWRAFCGAITNILLNLVFLELYGLKGAAYATTISFFVAAFLFDFFNIRTRKIFFMKINTLNPRRIFS